jgi:hypothetical protein
MNSAKNPGRRGTKNSEPDAVGSERDCEEYGPLSVRNARRMRRDMWPYLWMSFASMIVLAAALAILVFRMGVQRSH